MKFTRMTTIGEVPSPRTWHSTSVLRDEKQICVHGGFDGENVLNDLFIFDLGMFV